MKPEEAMEWAADFCERTKVFDPIRNERGYANNWTPPTPQERVAVIQQVADRVIDLPEPAFITAAILSKIRDWAEGLRDDAIGARDWEVVVVIYQQMMKFADGKLD